MKLGAPRKRLWFLIAAFLTASAASSIAVYRRFAAEQAGHAAQARRYEILLARLRIEKPQVSGLSSQPTQDQRWSVDKENELLRLRRERDELSGVIERLERVRADNRHLQAQMNLNQPAHKKWSETELNDKLRSETAQAMRQVLLQLRPALEQYSAAHAGAWPREFIELKPYLSNRGEPMPGLHSFEFVLEKIPRVWRSDTLLLREGGGHQKPDGTWGRFYAFGDGRIIEVSPPNDDFDNWERSQHGGAATKLESVH